jgi:hypothetical protein
MGTNVALLSDGIMWGRPACFATVPRHEHISFGKDQYKGEETRRGSGHDPPSRCKTSLLKTIKSMLCLGLMPLRDMLKNCGCSSSTTDLYWLLMYGAQLPVDTFNSIFQKLTTYVQCWLTASHYY